MRGLVNLVLAGACAMLLPGTAGAVSPAAAIRHLNQQRQANGIPAGISLSGGLSRGCRKHDRWMARHHLIVHGETKGSAGYSTAGDQAGQHSVLGFGTGVHWSSVRDNPWENAPIHLSQLLDPTLKVSGYDESQSFQCAQTLAPPRRAASAPRLYTYPGPGAAIYRGQRAAEHPFTPGQLVGIPQGRLTGPYLYLLIAAPHPDEATQVLRAPAEIVSASLRQAGGAHVPLATLDTKKPAIRYYIPPGGYLIPRRPLKAGRLYEAKAEVGFEGEVLSRTWRFRATSRIIGP